MKYSVLASAVAAISMMIAPVAMAEVKVSTKGGFQLKDDDFEAKLGGRIHLDGIYYVDEDDLKTIDKVNSTTAFRRARLTLEGRVYDWTYKFENDFAGQGQATGSGFREMWIGTKALGHNVRLGQAKPYRAMEELTSSNEITFMERPFASASGLYPQFQEGIFADAAGDFGAADVMAYGYGVSAYNTRDASQAATQGLGYSARGYVVPLRAEGQLLHLGFSTSVDRDPVNNAGKLTNETQRASVRLVGRDGLRQNIAAAAEKRDTYAVELAYKAGPVQLQAEYASSQYDVFTAAANNKPASTADQQVDTAYVQASYFVTGHQRIYDFKKGIFKAPKVESGAGALELKARYDMIENKDTNAEGVQYMVGANYYFNPNVRLMLEYVNGTATSTAGVDTEASAIQTRLQFGF